MKSTWFMLAPVAGIVLFTMCGSQIAHQIGVEQWQMAGFVVGLLLWTAPTWEVHSRLKKLESKVAEIDARISR